MAKLFLGVGSTAASARAAIEAVGPGSPVAPTPGQGLVWDGTAWGPSVGGGAGNLVWALGVPWSTIAPLVASVGMAILMVEGDPFGAPRTITGTPDGMGGYLPQDFSNILFVGSSSRLETNLVTVNLDLGVSLTPGILRSKDIMWAPLYPDLVSGPTAAYEVDLDGGGITPPGPLGGGSVFRANTTNGRNSFRLRNGAILDGGNLAATDEAISRVRPEFNGEVVIYVESFGGVIGQRSFINFVAPVPIFPFPLPVSVTGIVFASMDAKTRIDPNYQATTAAPHSLVTIMGNDGERDQSKYVAYDPALTTPDIGVTDVQSALDVLKIGVPLSGTTLNRPSASYLGQQYFDTDLVPPRPIFWDGAQWVNADGTGPV